MATREDVEAYLIRAGVEYDEVEEGTWVVRGQETHSVDVVVRVEDPIVVYRVKVMSLPEQGQERFLRQLLELNAREMLYASFGLEDSVVVVGGAQQLESLDYNEFQAMLDDLSLAVTEHFATLKQAAGA
jgi:hypothetical protein